MAYKLYTRLLFTPYSRKMHADAQDGDPDGDEVAKAYDYFLDIMCSFSHVLGSGWKRSVTENLQMPDVIRNRIRLLEGYVQRLSGVFIECRDALDIIDTWDSPETLFYLDPPYPGADQGHYRGFTSEDFQRLVARLGKIKGSFLLSNYDQPNIPAEWERFEFGTVMSAPESRRSPRTEIVWRKVSTLPPSERGEKFISEVFPKSEKD